MSTSTSSNVQLELPSQELQQPGQRIATIFTIQLTGKGQGRAKERTTGAAGARDMTHLKPLGMFFFFFLLIFIF